MAILHVACSVETTMTIYESSLLLICRRSDLLEFASFRLILIMKISDQIHTELKIET